MDITQWLTSIEPHINGLETIVDKMVNQGYRTRADQHTFYDLSNLILGDEYEKLVKKHPEIRDTPQIRRALEIFSRFGTSSIPMKWD
jgi:hypothetical protein